MERNEVGRKLPYAAVMHISGARAESSSRNCGSFAEDGVKMLGMESSSASWCTGDLVRRRLRPTGAGGCVTTPEIENVDAGCAEKVQSFCKVCAATDGVPRNTMRFFGEVELQVKRARFCTRDGRRGRQRTAGRANRTPAKSPKASWVSAITWTEAEFLEKLNLA